MPTNPLVQQALDTQAAANQASDTGTGLRILKGSAATSAGATNTASATAQPSVSAATTDTTGTTTGVATNPLVQQALDTQATANEANAAGLRILKGSAANAGDGSATQQTTDQQAAVNALSGFQAPSTANAQGTEDNSLPKTVITPNGPKILMPGQAQGQARGNAGGVPGLPPNAKGVPGGGKAEGKGNSGGARPNGGARSGGGAAAAAKVGAS